KTPEIAAFAGSRTGDEEGHVVLLGLQHAGAGERQQRHGGESREFQLGGHGFSLVGKRQQFGCSTAFCLSCPAVFCVAMITRPVLRAWSGLPPRCGDPPSEPTAARYTAM